MMKIFKFLAKVALHVFIVVSIVVCIIVGIIICSPIELTLKEAIHQNEAAEGPLWKIRSRHFLYGMPVPVDHRYDFQPEGYSTKVCGISVLAREGFWIGHCDRFRAPLWVCFSWTRDYLEKSKAMGASPRNFKEDEELPPYARASPDFSFSITRLDRSHMSPQESNQAWGEDNVKAGCLMSNIVAHNLALNRGIWKKLEIVHQNMSLPSWAKVERIWVICGAVFEDLQPEQYLLNKVGVPQATYKIIAWLTEDGILEAHGFIFPQSASGSDLSLYLVTVDEIEEQTGLDFFRDLADKEENRAEAALSKEIWMEI